MPILKLLIVFLPFLTASQQWYRVKTDEKISFLFPNVPQKSTEIINGIPSTIYQTKALAYVTGVVCSDLSSKKIELSGEIALLFYEELKKSTLDIETAIIKNEKTVPYDGMLIKEIEYSIIKDKYEMTYFKRFIFRDSFIYQISIGGRTRHLRFIQEARETFFNSVSFPESPEKKE